MSFRCLFLIRISDLDKSDLHPYCYKHFGSLSKIKFPEYSHSSQLPNFSDWYQFVLKAISDSSYMNFDEISIKDYIYYPVYKIKTNIDVLEPCILINKNNFVFGGLLHYPIMRKSKSNFKYDFGASVDFIYGMTSFFLNIIKRRDKIKMSDLMIEFYNFIKIMCPYGTPITSNCNLVEFFRSPGTILKSLPMISPEKTIVSINQLPTNTLNRHKELKVTIKEIVTGVQHESKNGQAKSDIDIIGEIIISASNIDLNGEITFTVKSNSIQKFFLNAIITDVLLHPSCTSCNYQTPVTVSMNNRKPINDLLDKAIDESSPNSPTCFLNENSLVQSVTKRYSINSASLNRRLQVVSRASSICSNNEVNNMFKGIKMSVKPWSDSYTLLSYKIMQCPADTELDSVTVPFISAIKCPEPPIICSYQLEDMSTEPEEVSNIMFRISLNPNYFSFGDKLKSIEFSKLEVLFPFHNRSPLFDVSRCTVSQGKLIILDQNRHLMIWSLGSILKKNEASLMGSVKFQADTSQPPFVDKFCLQPNAYTQINFALKSNNLSGLSVDTRNISFSIDTGVKVIPKQECISYNFKVWNSLGICPVELSN